MNSEFVKIKYFIVFLTVVFSALSAFSQPSINTWRSSDDGRFQLTPVTDITWSDNALTNSDNQTAISIDPQTTYQPILGFGVSLEHASCYNLSQLTPDLRSDTIKKLLHPTEGIGMNLMRICIGTSDFVKEPYYTYNDMPEGEKDPDLSEFSIEKDRDYIIPILKQALEINPELRFIASPWSPPAWMKTSQSLREGKLKPEYYDIFARYLIKFIQAYEAEGIPIYAITVQNEPDYTDPDYPTCRWTADEQRVFIKDHIGPKLEQAGLNTEIWCWDHNWHLVEFPRTILNDPEAAQYVDGTAFHLYEGEVEAQTILHNEFPHKPIYFTEGSVYLTDGAIEIMDILHNWSRSYNAWVIFLDEHQKPNRGPHHADPTPIELLDDGTVRYNPDYYIYGQFMKFIPSGSVRIKSEGELQNGRHIAFKTPSGQTVFIAANNDKQPQSISVSIEGNTLQDTLPARSVTTYQW